MKKILLLLLFVIAVDNALAQTTMPQNMDTGAKTYEDSELELAKVYQSVVGIVAKENKKTLVRAQKEWLKYRESECSFQASDVTDNDTDKAAINKDCLFRLNKLRIHELKASYIILRLK